MIDPAHSYAFLKTLEQRSFQFGRKGVICADMFQRSFFEWEYCRQEKEKLCSVHHFNCPACTNRMLAICLDGNMKCLRFKRKKESDECPYFDGVFKVNDQQVSTFVEQVCHDIEHVQAGANVGELSGMLPERQHGSQHPNLMRVWRLLSVSLESCSNASTCTGARSLPTRSSFR